MPATAGPPGRLGGRPPMRGSGSLGDISPPPPRLLPAPPMLRCRCEVKRPRATIHTARGAWLGWFDAFPLWVAREHDGGDGMKFIQRPSRRDVLRGIGVGGVMLATGACAPALWRRPRVAGAAPPGQLHLQFGSDAGREMVASWATP